MIEKWKASPISKHEVSDTGKVRRAGDKRVLKSTTSADGYKRVCVWCSDGKRRGLLVHRFVAMTFISNYSEQLVVNHKNLDKIDNRLENLEVCTRAENNKHARANLVFVTDKLSKDKAIRIRRLFALGVTTTEIMKIYDISRTTARECIKGITWMGDQCARVEYNG